MKKEKQNILILDGGHKKTLAIVRSLGKIGDYHLDVTAYHKRSICFCSKYTNGKIILTNPKLDAVKYKQEILSTLRNKKYLTIIPSDYLSFQLCAEIKKEIQKYTHIRIANAELLMNAGNKQWVHKVAQSLNIPVPYSSFLESAEDIELLSRETVEVLKSAEESGDNFLKYPKTISEAKSLASVYFNERSGKVLIAQERVVGDGYGFFAYYRDGVCKSYFIHHRIREYPPSGGYSVAAEGYYDDEIEMLGKKILDHLKWDGVAMVEFKKDIRHDKYLLLEINAKFWGSLDLAVANGVDFPLIWAKDAEGQYLPKSVRYGTKKYQWILNGELFHIFAKPSSMGRVFTDMFSSHKDISWRDIKPNMFQLANIPMHYYKKWFR